VKQKSFPSLRLLRLELISEFRRFPSETAVHAVLLHWWQQAAIL
jgi:hypothetical protein